MAKVKLFGGVTYNAFGVDEGSHSDDLKETLTQAYGNYSWNSDTKLLANFNEVTLMVHMKILTIFKFIKPWANKIRYIKYAKLKILLNV